MLNFINTGLDEATLESVRPYTHDTDLIKAMSKQGLVQREVTVQGKGGTFTRKQWVRASEEQTNPRQAAKQGETSGNQIAKQDEPDTGSKRFTSLNEFLSGKTLNGKTPKAGIVSVLSSGVSRKDLMSAAKAAGVTWKENANEGINWMRASMAIQKHLSGASAAPAQANSQADSQTGSSQDSKAAEKDTKQATKGDSSASGGSQSQATKSDTTDTTTDYAKELGVDASSMSAWDDKTLTSMRDTFNQSIVNMIQARDTAKRQAEMYYKSGNDTLRKQCEEMSATYDKQADKYISAMLVVTKEIISRQNSSGNTSTTQSK